MLIVTNGKQTGFIGTNKIYIGRSNKTYGVSSSIWANPYIIGDDGGRDSVIRKHKLWLTDELVNNPTKYKAEFDKLVELYNSTNVYELVCWCKPYKCHGDTLLELVKEAVNNKATYTSSVR